MHKSSISSITESDTLPLQCTQLEQTQITDNTVVQLATQQQFQENLGLRYTVKTYRGIRGPIITIQSILAFILQLYGFVSNCLCSAVLYLYLPDTLLLGKIGTISWFLERDTFSPRQKDQRLIPHQGESRGCSISTQCVSIYRQVSRATQIYERYPPFFCE